MSTYFNASPLATFPSIFISWRDLYIFLFLQEQFGSSIVSVIRPGDGGIGSCHSGPRFGISSLVSSVVHPQNVFRRVTFPAEREDRMMRPVYITSVAGRSLCEHR
ncbi:hypothetical protein BS47DRAFT_1346364 [Hydnum rufescens UP504]|uniref:Uncharacterized protein n=1 Tax=Hydnum rufescens UP504 TaxID=1448309 RepID=A0A9P6AVU8_9AGAM|nr:hypothetical protein BS47DRAFT_1346364 [Hydnum rufescens UP504]